MQSVWIDTRDGALLFGEEALAERQDAYPDEIVSLAEVIVHDELAESLKSPNKLDCDDLNRDDYIAYGKWVVGLLDPVIDTPVRDNHYQKLYELGAGPEPRRMWRRFGNITGFHEVLGAKILYCRGRYDDWSRDDFANYAHNLASGLGRKPKDADYQTTFQSGGGPSPALIRQRLGGISALNESIGYPNIADWSEDDYIDWGVRVVSANPGMRLTRDVFDALSKIDRGPSTRTIVNHFGALSKFQRLIEEEHERRTLELEREREAKLTAYSELAEQGDLPPELLLDESNTFENVGKYLVIKRVAPEYPAYKAKILAMQQTRTLIPALKRHDPKITAATVEVTASMLGVFDDIWPPDANLEQLSVQAQGLRSLLRILGNTC